MALTRRFPSPQLRRVTSWDGLVVPAVWSPKARLAGERHTAGVPATGGLTVSANEVTWVTSASLTPATEI